LYKQPINHTAIAIGRTKEEALAGILSAYEDAPDLEVIDVHPASDEEIEELGEGAREKIAEMTKAAEKTLH
jgi:uncharacterized protein YpuA (DUF1002 family)